MFAQKYIVTFAIWQIVNTRSKNKHFLYNLLKIFFKSTFYGLWPTLSWVIWSCILSRSESDRLRDGDSYIKYYLIGGKQKSLSSTALLLIPRDGFVCVTRKIYKAHIRAVFGLSEWCRITVLFLGVRETKQLLNELRIFLIIIWTWVLCYSWSGCSSVF